MSTGTKIGIAGAAAVALVGGYVILTQKASTPAPSSSPGTTSTSETAPAQVALTASATSINAGQTVTFGVVVLDAKGFGVPGAAVTLGDETTGNTSSGTTDSSGNVSFELTYPDAGRFIMTAMVQ